MSERVALKNIADVSLKRVLRRTTIRTIQQTALHPTVIGEELILALTVPFGPNGTARPHDGVTRKSCGMGAMVIEPLGTLLAELLGRRLVLSSDFF
jgi:hypothetical protein